MSTPPLIIIAGPNASGKSEFAVKLAKKFNGEIVSADSRQVYKGLDIGSGKVPGKWQAQHLVLHATLSVAKKRGRVFMYKGIAHHCIDFVPPKKRFTVAEYQACAADAISNIHARGSKRPRNKQGFEILSRSAGRILFPKLKSWLPGNASSFLAFSAYSRTTS